MFKSLILRFWVMRKEFVKYFVVGTAAFVFDVGSLYLLKEQLDLSATLAVIINQPVILVTIFFINKHWSFKAGGTPFPQLVRFILLSVFNYLFSVSWMYVVHDRLGLYYLLTRITNILFAVSWNFVLYKFWVYRADFGLNRAFVKVEPANPGRPLD